MSPVRAVPDPAVRGRLSHERIRALATPRRLDWVVGALVLVLYALVQLLFLLGPHPFDPARYFRTSFDWPHVNPNLWTLRLGLMVPVRVAVGVFNRSEAAMYAVPLAVGLLLAAAVYLTMVVLFKDRLAAAGAALVTVLNTNFLLNSSSIFPDTAATATFAAGFLCLILGAGSMSARGWRHAPGVMAACAGLLFGWTYLIREFSPVLLPVVAAVVVLLHYPVRRIVLLAAAAVATVALEFIYGLVIFDRPFIHLETLLERGDNPGRLGIRGFRIGYIENQVDDPLSSLMVFPRLLVAWWAGWLFLVLLALFVAALIVFRRDRRLWILAVWCFGYWAVMVLIPFVPNSSGRWLLNITNIRYWYPLFPPLAMGAFGGLLLLVRRYLPDPRLRVVLPSAAPVLAAVVLFPGFVEFDRCADMNLWRNDPAARWHELRTWFATEGARGYDVLRTDPDTARLVPAFTRTTFGDRLWSGSIRTFRGPADVRVYASPERSLILLHYARLTVVSLVEANVQRLRPDWEPLFVSDDRMMVVLAYRPPAAGVVHPDRPWWKVPRREIAAASGCGLSPYEPEAG